MTEAQPRNQLDPAKNISITVNQTGGRFAPGASQAGVVVKDSVVTLQVQQIQSLHQLPAPPADFTGRKAELEKLRTVVAVAGSGGALIAGMGGVGKTALALVLAHELRERYSDAQFYVDLRGATEKPAEPREALEHVIRGFVGLEAKLPASEGELAALYRSRLDGQRVLLLLDNARSAEQVAPFLPPPGCLLLVTSRWKFFVRDLHELDLDALSPDDAQALLLKIAERIGEDAAAVAEVCANLPLALTLAGTWVREHRTTAPAAYVRRCHDVAMRLQLTGTDLALQVSYDTLKESNGGEALQAAWRMLAVFPGTFDLNGAAAVWGKFDGVESEEAAQAAVEDRMTVLVNASLLDWDDAKRRYRLHDLAREFARAKMFALSAGSGRSAEQDAAGRRHAEHYMQVLSAANDLYLTGNKGIGSGLALFDGEFANIEAGRAWAVARAEADDGAARLGEQYARSAWNVLDLRLHGREHIRWLEQALAAARRLNDREAQGALLGNLGTAHFSLGETRRAIEYNELALAIDRELGDRRSVGHDLGNLGNAYADLGETRRAIEFHEQALAALREIGDRRGEGNALGNLGIAYADLGETRRAIDLYEQQLAIAREIGSRYGEAVALGNLGDVYASLGETLRVIKYNEQALDIAREIGDQRGEADALSHRALALADLGEREQAIADAEAALKIYLAIEDPHAEIPRKRLAEWKAEGAQGAGMSGPAE
jgi:tetratricopeptide (TPR) repeat protein